MKKLLITTALVVAVATGALAQGKVSVVNDSTRAITYSTDTASLMEADVAKAGLKVANNSAFRVQLWYNTGATGAPAAESSLVAYNSTWVLSNTAFPAGQWSAQSVTLSGANLAPIAVTAGSQGTFEIRAWSAASTSWADALLAFAAGTGYIGKTAVFTCTTGSSLSPTALNNIASSTWAAGPVYMTTTVVPEPSSMALAGLGAAALLIFRRRR